MEKDDRLNELSEKEEAILKDMLKELGSYITLKNLDIKKEF